MRDAAMGRSRQLDCMVKSARRPTDHPREDATSPRRYGSGRVRRSEQDRKKAEKTLTAGGRGTNEASRLLFPGGRSGLGFGRGRTHGNQDHRGCNRRGRSRGVHHHAQRAMVSVTLRGVQVRHLHNRQESCQNNTNHRGYSPGGRAAALRCLKPCLNHFPDRHAKTLCIQHTQSLTPWFPWGFIARNRFPGTSEPLSRLSFV